MKIDHPWRRLTADKREIKDFPKLPSATSFIRRTLYGIMKKIPVCSQNSVAGVE